MREKIIYKNTDYFHDFERMLIILFYQMIVSFFLFLTLNSIFSRELQDNESYIILLLGDILLLILSYFHIRGIKNCFLYFLPFEEYTIDKDKLYYEKKLNLIGHFWTIEKFTIFISEIEDIIALPPRKFIYISTDTLMNPLLFILYFKPLKRVCLELKSGKKYYVLNYIKRPKPFDFFADNKESEFQFKIIYENLKKFIENGKKTWQIEIRNLESKIVYNLSLDERYNHILSKIIDEEKIYLFRKEENYLINADKEVINELRTFDNIQFEETNFYVFYVNCLSKKENENKKVIVGYNGVDGKEVTFKELKEDINKIRDSKSTFLAEIK